MLTHSCRAACDMSAQMEQFNIWSVSWVHGNVTTSSYSMAEVEMLVWFSGVLFEVTAPSTPIQPPRPDVLTCIGRKTDDDLAIARATNHQREGGRFRPRSRGR
jgi:hypothetical protein